MAIIRTAQYKYTGKDRLDITIKGKDPIGVFFAPTWDMVIDHMHGIMDDAQYEKLYHKMMLKSYREHRDIWDKVLSRPVVTLVCYCRPGRFCHRVLLAKYLKKLGATYLGEKKV